MGSRQSRNKQTSKTQTKEAPTRRAPPQRQTSEPVRAVDAPLALPAPDGAATKERQPVQPSGSKEQSEQTAPFQEEELGGCSELVADIPPKPPQQDNGIPEGGVETHSEPEILASPSPAPADASSADKCQVSSDSEGNYLSSPVCVEESLEESGGNSVGNNSQEVFSPLPNLPRGSPIAGIRQLKTSMDGWPKFAPPSESFVHCFPP